MEFTIRQATEKDFSVIQRLNAASFVNDAANDDVLDTEWPYSQQGVGYYKESLVDTKKCVFIAEDTDKNSLGYIMGSSVNKFRYRNVRTGELENMFVVSNWRRRGVGKALVGELRRWMKAKGVDRMYVSAYAKNEDAIRFYDSCGFDLWEVGLEMKV